VGADEAGREISLMVVEVALVMMTSGGELLKAMEDPRRLRDASSRLEWRMDEGG
jgi:hypothetical protein